MMITPLKNANLFSGNGYLLIPSSGATVTFEAEVPISSNYFIVVRYKVRLTISSLIQSLFDTVCFFYTGFS